MSIPLGKRRFLSLDADADLRLDTGERVSVASNATYLMIGCVAISWEAWELIEAKVAAMKGREDDAVSCIQG